MTLPGEEKLKSCPFCGGEANVWNYDTESKWSRDIVTVTNVGCAECNFHLDSEPDEEPQALSAWNRRPEGEASVADSGSALHGRATDDGMRERVARTAYAADTTRVDPDCFPDEDEIAGDWFDREAAMPLSGPGFKARWLRIADAILAALSPVPSGEAEVLKDPTAVHLNMLRGGIAKLTPAQIGHLYRGDEAREIIAEIVRQNPDVSPASGEGPLACSVDGDTPLQAAAREAGWALSELVDTIAWEKRGQVYGIIGRLSLALSPSATDDGVKLEGAVSLLEKRCAEIDQHYARYPNTLDRSMAETAAAIRAMLTAQRVDHEETLAGNSGMNKRKAP